MNSLLCTFYCNNYIGCRFGNKTMWMDDIKIFTNQKIKDYIIFNENNFKNRKFNMKANFYGKKDANKNNLKFFLFKKNHTFYK